MSERITGAEATRMLSAYPHAHWGMDADETAREVASCWACSFVPRLATQLDTDAAELAALRGEAEQWKALVKAASHRTRDWNRGFGLAGDGWWSCWAVGGRDPVEAPTPVALLAKLDDIAEAAKPKAERWRWQYSNDRGTATVTQNSYAEGLAYGQKWDLSGEPMRELRNPRGHVLLLPEGEPIPSEGGPWE